MSTYYLLRITLSQNRVGWEICACKYHFHTLLYDLHMQIWVRYIHQEFSQSRCLAFLKLLNPSAYGTFLKCCCGFILSVCYSSRSRLHAQGFTAFWMNSYCLWDDVKWQKILWLILKPSQLITLSLVPSSWRRCSPLMFWALNSETYCSRFRLISQWETCCTLHSWTARLWHRLCLGDCPSSRICDKNMLHYY